MIKLIALDLDGTLMYTDHITVTEENRAALKKAHEKGASLAVATGRTLAIIGDVCEQIPEIDYVIYSNGAAVYDRRQSKNIYTSFGVNTIHFDKIRYMESDKLYCIFSR